MNLTTLVELANHISESLNNHFHDIGDLDFMIEELTKKRKGIARRMEKDANQLKTIMTDATFAHSVTDKAMQEFREAIEGVDELVEIINGDLNF